MSGKLTAPDGWEPEFPGQRPPFAPGHRLSVGNRGPLTHGIHSPRLVDPIAKRVIAELKAIPELDYLSTPRFQERLQAYARTVAQSELLDNWMGTQDMATLTASEGGRTSPLELARELTVKASTLAGRLGILPDIAPDVQAEIVKARRTIAKRASRAQLQADLKADIAEQWFGGAK